MVLGEGLPGYRGLPSHIGLQHILPKNKREYVQICRLISKCIAFIWIIYRLNSTGGFCILSSLTGRYWLDHYQSSLHCHFLGWDWTYPLQLEEIGRSYPLGPRVGIRYFLSTPYCADGFLGTAFGILFGVWDWLPIFSSLPITHSIHTFVQHCTVHMFTIPPLSCWSTDILYDQANSVTPICDIVSILNIWSGQQAPSWILGQSNP